MADRLMHRQPLREPVTEEAADVHAQPGDAQLFERLFLRSVALCREHGLIDGTHLSVDGFHVEANAALASLRASLEPVTVPGEGDELRDGGAGASAEAPPADRSQLSLAEPRSGPTPKRRSSNATSASRSDPDAKLRGKPGQRPHLVHRGQIAVDPRARCVVACLGEQADGHEGDALALITDRARFACPQLESVGADQGFAAERVWGAIAERGIEAFVPPQRTMLPRDGGEPKTAAQRAAQAARERCQTPRGVWSHRQRMADAEGVVGELKQRHGLDRARSRGTPLFHVQVLLGCAALNLKRLATHAGEAASGAAAGPQTSPIALDASAGGSAPAEGIHWCSITAPPAPDATMHRLALPIWTIDVSLN